MEKMMGHLVQVIKRGKEENVVGKLVDYNDHVVWLEGENGDWYCHWKKDIVTVIDLDEEDELFRWLVLEGIKFQKTDGNYYIDGWRYLITVDVYEDDGYFVCSTNHKERADKFESEGESREEATANVRKIKSIEAVKRYIKKYYD